MEVTYQLAVTGRRRDPNPQTLHGTGIFTYIGVVSGVNVGIYGDRMECLAYIGDVSV